MNGHRPIDVSEVLWRRQFVAGTDLPDLTDEGFELHRVGELDLWADPELRVQTVGVSTVVGHCASLAGDDLSTHLGGLTAASTVDQAAEVVANLTGRFAVFVALAGGVVLIPDGLASKRVFLSRSGHIASSSERLLQRCGAEARERTTAETEILESSRLPAREYATLGLYSAASGFRRLLPNRIANLTTGAVAITRCGTDPRSSTVGGVAEILRRNAIALSTLGPIQIGLTAGFDSRLVLAAFEAIGVEVETFTFTDGRSKKEGDAAEARRVADAIGYRHVSVEEPEPDERVLELLRASQLLVRPLRHVTAQLTWFAQTTSPDLYVSGMGGEISRSRFGYVPPSIGREISRRIALGHAPAQHDLESFDEWWDDRYRPDEPRPHLPPTTLHHWEQRVAIWGVQFMAEKDHFIDEAPAFSSAAVQRALLGFPQRTRTSLTSGLFLDLIEELSPGLARLGPPERSPWQHRLYDATPLPRLLRTARPGWGTSR